MRARLLRTLLRRFGSRPDRAGTRAALEFTTSGRSGAGIRIAGGVRLEREYDRIRLRRAEPPGPDRALRVPGPDPGAGEAVLDGRAFRFRWGPGPGTGDAVAFAADALRFPLEVRAWRAGDRIRLPYGTKKLKKLFNERRIGRARRARTPVLAELEGRVLWVAGLARAAGTEPRAGRPTFHLTWTDDDRG